MGVYPFMYGTTQDFKPVVDGIIAAGLKPPYNWDEYASHFFAHAESLVSQAKESQNKEKASELFMYVLPSPSSFDSNSLLGHFSFPFTSGGPQHYTVLRGSQPRALGSSKPLGQKVKRLHLQVSKLRSIP